jgi:hypothetical protein
VLGIGGGRSDQQSSRPGHQIVEHRVIDRNQPDAQFRRVGTDPARVTQRCPERVGKQHIWQPNPVRQQLHITKSVADGQSVSVA